MLPGQQLAAVAYTTKNGAACQQRLVRFGSSNNHYDTALLFTRDNLNRSAATPVVFYCHGSTANEGQVLEGGVYHKGAQSLLDSWLDQGWIVLSLRLGTTVTSAPGVYPATDSNDGKWGNQPSRLGAKAGWSWLKQWQKLHAKGVLLCGFSAGGTFAPNIAIESLRGTVEKVAALALIDPACNLANNYQYLSTSRDKIGPAYSLTPGPNNTYPLSLLNTADWHAKIDNVDGGHDTNLVPLTAGAFPQVPVLISASPNDATVDDVANGVALRDRLLAAGWVATQGNAREVLFDATTGGHGATGHFDAALITPFFQRALALP